MTEIQTCLKHEYFCLQFFTNYTKMCEIQTFFPDFRDILTKHVFENRTVSCCLKSHLVCWIANTKNKLLKFVGWQQHFKQCPVPSPHVWHTAPRFSQPAGVDPAPPQAKLGLVNDGHGLNRGTTQIWLSLGRSDRSRSPGTPPLRRGKSWTRCCVSCGNRKFGLVVAPSPRNRAADV